MTILTSSAKEETNVRFAGEMIAETSSNYSIWCYAHPPHPVSISLGEKCCILEADPHFLLTINEKKQLQEGYEEKEIIASI